MKNTTYLFLAGFLFAGITNGYSQDLKEPQVPQAVRAAFGKLHPGIQVQEWDYSRKQQEYDAEFVSKDIKYEAYFTRDGRWIRTERDLDKANLPQEILAGLANTEYAAWEIDDVEEHQSPEHSLFYEIQVEKGKQEVYLYFSPDGKIIRPTK